MLSSTEALSPDTSSTVTESSAVSLTREERTYFTIPHSLVGPVQPESLLDASANPLLEFFAVVAWPFSGIVLPFLVGFDGTRRLFVNLCFWGPNPADIDPHQAPPNTATHRRWLMAFHHLPTAFSEFT